MATIGENVRKYRLLAKMTQAELAAKVGQQPSTIGDLENKNGTSTRLVEIAAALGVTPEQLKGIEPGGDATVEERVRHEMLSSPLDLKRLLKVHEEVEAAIPHLTKPISRKLKCQIIVARYAGLKSAVSIPDLLDIFASK